MKANEKDHFDLLIEICKFVQNNLIDTRKFATLKAQALQFMELRGRRMSLEEFQDYCKTLFQDHKFIDMILKFLRGEEEQV